MTQNLFPSADSAAGSWTTTPLWSKVDDEPGSGDADNIDAAVRGGDQACTLTGGDLSDPLSAADHVISVRAKYTTNGTRVGAVKVELLEGATVRATLGASWQTLSTSYATYTYTLSAAEADAMTYSSINWRITGHMNTGGSGTQCNVQVASVKFSCPDAGVASGQPMQLRGTGVLGLRLWQPDGRVYAWLRSILKSRAMKLAFPNAIGAS